MQLNVCSSGPFPNLSCNASPSWQIVILLLFLGKLIIFKFVSVLFLRKRMCIILSLTENYYFIKISAHLHYVRKLLEFKVLWECRCCADFRDEGKSSSTGCSFFFMISPLSIMILMVSLQSTNGIFVIWHYEELRGKEFGLQTNGICIYLHSVCTKANMLIYSEI